jgi:hypothetical protein
MIFGLRGLSIASYYICPVTHYLIRHKLLSICYKGFVKQNKFNEQKGKVLLTSGLGTDETTVATLRLTAVFQGFVYALVRTFSHIKILQMLA